MKEASIREEECLVAHLSLIKHCLYSSIRCVEVEEDGYEARPLSRHLRENKYIHPLPGDQFKGSRGMKGDMLTCLLSVKSDKQYSHSAL